MSDVRFPARQHLVTLYPPMSKKLETEIRNDLKKTGFPLEVSVSLELDREKWMVYPGALYKDPETSTSREIDIHAVKVDFTYANKIPSKPTLDNLNRLISHLIIQCRKTDKPWVIFDNGNLRWPQIPTQNFKSDKEEFHEMLLHDIKHIRSENLGSFGLKKHRYIKANFHKSYHEAFSPPQERSKIYEAFITVAKALDYFKNHYATGRYVIHLFIPVIVLDGTLWSASIKKTKNNNDRVVLKNVDRLFVVFNRLIPFTEGSLFWEEDQVIEVITRKAFRKNLNEIQKDNRELYKCWTKFINSRKLTARPRRFDL